MTFAPRLCAALLALLALSLAGCAPESRGLPSQPSSSASASPAATGTPTASPVPAGEAVPVSASCAQLVSDQTIYDWGSGNFAVDPAYSPAPDSEAARAVAEGGRACGWVNLTSNETLAIAVAMPSADGLAAARAAIPASRAATSELGSGIEAYFEVDGGIGRLDAFARGYWLSASSPWFATASDASTIVDAALDALP